MESRGDLLSKLVVEEFKWLDSIVYCNYMEVQLRRCRCEALIRKIEMENNNVTKSEKRRLVAKLDCALKEIENARESGDIKALAAAKIEFRKVQEEVKKAYGE